MTDHRQSLYRKRLLKVYRKEITTAAVLVLLGLTVFVVLGWKGFFWIKEVRSQHDVNLFSLGTPRLVISACALFLIEALVLNFTVIFIARIRCIYKKAAGASK